MTRDAHAEVVELLPWLVNGTLADDERSRVETHVHGCLTCYAALQQERRLAALIRGRSAGSVSAEQGFERLVSRIDGEAPGRSRPRRRRYAVPAAAAGVAVAVGVAVWAGLGGAPSGGAPAYETLTRAEARAGPRLDIVFAESLSEAGIRDVLGEIDATIVAGPTEIGRYTVRLDGARTDAELAALIARLMRDGRVRFAGRSFIEESR